MIPLLELPNNRTCWSSPLKYGLHKHFSFLAVLAQQRCGFFIGLLCDMTSCAKASSSLGERLGYQSGFGTTIESEKLTSSGLSCSEMHVHVILLGVNKYTNHAVFGYASTQLLVASKRVHMCSSTYAMLYTYM